MKIQIIVGSTRPNRVTDRAGKWIANVIKEQGKAEAEIIDLRDYPLEIFNEDNSPQYNPGRKPSQQTKNWLDKLAEADSYIIITPEYNRAVSGVLKNALDYIDYQLVRKPVGLVSHGSLGGAFASANLRMILSQLGAVAAPTPAYLTHLANSLDEHGKLSDEAAANPYGPKNSLDKLLDELYWLTESLVK